MAAAGAAVSLVNLLSDECHWSLSMISSHWFSWWLRAVRQHAITWAPTSYGVTGSTHYSDVIMSAMASQITGVSIVYSTVCSSEDQRKHQSPVSLTFVRGIHRWPVNSPHKGLVTRKIFPFDDAIMMISPFQWRCIWYYLLADVGCRSDSQSVHVWGNLVQTEDSPRVPACRSPVTSNWRH